MRKAKVPSLLMIDHETFKKQIALLERTVTMASQWYEIPGDEIINAEEQNLLSALLTTLTALDLMLDEHREVTVERC